ncbi:MAG: tryptophan synthase subunit beta [Alphaproteobacteria bacterium GM202ARS2]|nr:tryptophan synthase subunit beta [Alphaproteobacteria bacterium GM202ARS2]
MLKATPPNPNPHTPDSQGRFGSFGGRFVSETLMPLLIDLEHAWQQAKDDPSFWQAFDAYARDYIGRPSPLYHAAALESHLRTHKAFKGILYFKREDLNHTGAHKINNCLGQVLLAKRMGKTRIIAETGAGQHGVATATVCARFSLPCTIYMGATDIQRQAPNVQRMACLNANIHAVDAGTATLKDALNEALRDWVQHVDDTFYIIGSVAGPHPYPMLVRDLQAIIGKETAQQLQDKGHAHPHYLIACVGGGSNAIGLFHPFLADTRVRMVGVEAAGRNTTDGNHAAALTLGAPGVLHGSYSYLLQNEDGQIQPVHSVAAGLDYPGVGPEHAFLKDTARVDYQCVNDQQALAALRLTAQKEGIISALETAHALAYVIDNAETFEKDAVIVINLSGRGDKDMQTLAEYP